MSALVAVLDSSKRVVVVDLMARASSLGSLGWGVACHDRLILDVNRFRADSLPADVAGPIIGASVSDAPYAALQPLEGSNVGFPFALAHIGRVDAGAMEWQRQRRRWRGVSESELIVRFLEDCRGGLSWHDKLRSLDARMTTAYAVLVWAWHGDGARVFAMQRGVSLFASSSAVSSFGRISNSTLLPHSTPYELGVDSVRR